MVLTFNYKTNDIFGQEKVQKDTLKDATISDVWKCLHIIEKKDGPYLRVLPGDYANAEKYKYSEFGVKRHNGIVYITLPDGVIDCDDLVDCYQHIEQLASLKAQFL